MLYTGIRHHIFLAISRYFTDSPLFLILRIYILMIVKRSSNIILCPAHLILWILYNKYTILVIFSKKIPLWHFIRQYCYCQLLQRTLVPCTSMSQLQFPPPTWCSQLQFPPPTWCSQLQFPPRMVCYSCLVQSTCQIFTFAVPSTYPILPSIVLFFLFSLVFGDKWRV